MFKLTWYVSVTILKGMEVVHEFFHRDLEGLKQASVFKEPERDLKHKNHMSLRTSPAIRDRAHLSPAHPRGGKQFISFSVDFVFGEGATVTYVF